MANNNNISVLQNSLMFTMSLSAKELFHSNFIVYLAQKHTGLFNEIMKKVTNDPNFEFDPNSQSIKREKSHTDIMIVNNVGKKASLIIENKFKSIPYREQLERYVNKVTEIDKDTKLILLCLTPNVINLNSNNGVVEVTKKGVKYNWQILKYDDFIKTYNNCFNNYNAPSEYAKSALEDYGTFVSSLIDYIDKHNITTSSKLSKLPITTDEMNLRMHDITSKIRYSTLASFVYDELKKRQINVVLDEKQKNYPYVFIKSAYEAAGPLMECNIRINLGNSYALYLIQVQNNIQAKKNTYGRGIIYYKDPKGYGSKHKDAWTAMCSDVQLKTIIGNKLVLNDNLSNSNWVQGNASIDGPKCATNNYPNCPKGKAKNYPYYHFNSFIIEKWDLDENKTIRDLVDDIVTDVNSIYSKL